MNKHPSFINIPVKEVGPIRIKNNTSFEDIYMPIATYEKTLWPSIKRGALISQLSNGISSIVLKNNMTRSIILEGSSSVNLKFVIDDLKFNFKNLKTEVKKTSKYANLLDFSIEIIGKLLYIRFEFSTDEASGHNMVTKACDILAEYICKKYYLKYISISGNLCSDKKVSSINGIMGRGKSIISEIIVEKEICAKYLRTMPSKIVELNIKKNLVGSILAGSIRSANAHYANILLSTYLPLGQDAANIVEGSQGITYASINGDGSLYFSINCPNIIVGTVGNGKNYEFVKEYFKKLKCDHKNGESSIRLACLIGATILCSELSLIASQTVYGELVRAHELYERNNNRL